LGHSRETWPVSSQFRQVIFSGFRGLGQSRAMWPSSLQLRQVLGPRSSTFGQSRAKCPTREVSVQGQIWLIDLLSLHRLHVTPSAERGSGQSVARWPDFLQFRQALGSIRSFVQSRARWPSSPQTMHFTVRRSGGASTGSCLQYFAGCPTSMDMSASENKARRLIYLRSCGKW
jgi:hypothetical protein